MSFLKRREKVRAVFSPQILERAYLDVQCEAIGPTLDGRILTSLQGRHHNLLPRERSDNPNLLAQSILHT